jgi:DNA modification methylase
VTDTDILNLTEPNPLAPRLLIGDCLDLLADVPAASIDMVFLDLPYGTTRNKWDSLVDLERLWPELIRVTSPDSPLVFTAQQPFTSALLMSKPELFRHHWVWEKTHATGHLNAKRAPMKAHEDVLVFSRKAPRYRPQKTQGHARKVSSAASQGSTRESTSWGKFDPHSYDSTERYPRTVQTFAMDKQKSALHPTQKPVALLEYLIRTYSDKGQTVLDPTAGSATTGVAAFNTGRKSLMFESDAVIATGAQRRLDGLVNG